MSISVYVCLDYEELSYHPSSHQYIESDISNIDVVHKSWTDSYFCLIYVNFTHFSCFIEGYKFYTFVIGFSKIQNCEISITSWSAHRPLSAVENLPGNASSSEWSPVKNLLKWSSLHLSVGPQTYLDSLIY